MPSILILEDDITFSLMLKTWLGRKGFEVSSVSSVSDARSRIEDASFDLILSDLRLPDGDGIDLLKWIKENNFAIPLIMMTSYAEIQTAVQAIKLGASDYIAKPLNPEELLGKIRDVIKAEVEPAAPMAGPERPLRSAKRPEPSGGTHSRYVEGQSQPARQLYEHVRLVAPTDMSVLITGSSGTGKEYVARRIHEQSNRRKAPFIAVDCGAIPKDLAASEFFGHVKGSFTGAIDNKEGAFVAAQGRSFWTRSATCRTRCRCSFYVLCRSGKSNRSAATRRSRSTSVLSPRQTRTCVLLSIRVISVKICIIVSTSLPSASPT